MIVSSRFKACVYYKRKRPVFKNLTDNISYKIYTMTFGGFFSYLNTTIYGVSIDANTDLRIETLPAAPGIAKVYFTDATVNFQLFFIKNN